MKTDHLGYNHPLKYFPNHEKQAVSDTNTLSPFQTIRPSDPQPSQPFKPFISSNVG